MSKTSKFPPVKISRCTVVDFRRPSHILLLLLAMYLALQLYIYNIYIYILDFDIATYVYIEEGFRHLEHHNVKPEILQILIVLGF